MPHLSRMGSFRPALSSFSSLLCFFVFSFDRYTAAFSEFVSPLLAGGASARSLVATIHQRAT